MAENTQYKTVPFVTETQVRKYQVFPGRITDNMQRLLTGKDKDGRQVDFPRVLATGEMLADARLHEDEADRNDLRRQYIHINLAIADDPNKSGEMAFKNESPHALKLNPETKLAGNCLPLSNEQYEEHRSGGFVFTKKEVKALQGNYYALPGRRREFWNYALGKHAEKYIDDVCSTLGMAFNDVMEIWLYPRDGLRLFAVGAVGGSGRWLNGDDYDLGSNCGCLLGVAPKNLGTEAQGKPEGRSVVAPTLEETLAIINNPDLNRQGMAEAITAKCQK